MRMLGVATVVAMLFACGPDRTFSDIPADVDDTTPPDGTPPDTTPPGTTPPGDPPPDTTPGDPPPDDPPVDPAPTDSDGDGLTDDEENDIFNTNPFDPDSDGDGWTDSDEIWNQGTDPNDSADNPDAGTGPDCGSIVATGDQIGQVTADFALTDQNGNQVHLHDYCEDLVLLVSSASWCGPCQAEAPELQALFAEYESQGFTVMTLLGEGDVSQWASAFGLQHPVLSDGGYSVSNRFTGGGSFSIPTMHLIGPGAVVLARDTWVSESQIQSNLP